MKMWEIHQNVHGVFVISYLGREPFFYRGSQVTPSISTFGEFKTREEAERALQRALKPKKYSTFYDAEGNPFE